MELSSELAQYIVDYTSKIVDYTINIMNQDAVIIASTDSGRIGEAHMGARKVMVSGQPYTINEEEAKNYMNVIPGISLPIHFRDRIIGVVGVGAGSQADTIGRFIQSTTELLIEQFYLKEAVNAEEQVRNEFLTHLLSESWFNNETYFNHQIKLHKFNKDQAYLVVTAELPSSTFEMHELNRYDSEILHYEKSIAGLLDSIKQRLNYLDIHLVYIPNAVTFLIPYNGRQEEDKEIFLERFISNLDFVLSQTLGLGYRIGIGGFAEDMTKIHTEYKHAMSAIKISGITRHGNNITSFNDVYFEYLLFSIPKSKRNKFYETIIGKLLEEDNEDGVWVETLETFFKNDRSVTKTAEELYIHRNTLLFRLNRIGKITGFYPQHLKDAMNLYMALTLWRLNNFENSSESTLSEN